MVALDLRRVKLAYRDSPRLHLQGTGAGLRAEGARYPATMVQSDFFSATAALRPSARSSWVSSLNRSS